MDDFHFYNSENDGYRGSFGDYTDPAPGQPTPPHSVPSGKKKRAARAAALVLACAVAGGGAGAGGAALYQHFHAASQKAVIQVGDRPKVETVVNSNSGKPMTPEQLYAANLDSCVGITVSTTYMNIYGQTSTSAASGSGFVLTQDGFIVTNYHVVEDAVKDNTVSVEVNFANGDKYPARLVGAAQENDVAVLKIEATGLTPVTLGDSDKLVVGEPVFAIGNPLGELTYSFTNGMVSALDRLISTGNSVTLNMLQTNCAINPGNSGGPLFDSYGNVIGITTAKYAQSQSGVSAEGLGFAIPINDVKNILPNLIEHGFVMGRPYMGVQVDAVSTDAQRYGIPAGAVVIGVTGDSPAEKAGLQPNDIIIKLDDTAIDSPSALTAALSTNYKAGEKAVVTVIRQGREMQLNITFGEKPAETQMSQQAQPPQQQPPANVFPFPFSPW